MDEDNYKKIMATIILFVLLVLSFFLLKPILLSVILGFVLGLIFMPIYDWLVKKTNSKNLSAYILCFILVCLIILFFWILAPIFVNQSIKFYLAIQKADFITPIQSLFPNLFKTNEFSTEFASVLRSFITNLANSAVTMFSNIILNSPILLLQSIVVFFSFFFILRDKEEFLSYLQSLLPFSQEVQKKLFKQTKEITISVLYGQIVIGILQGLVTGFGFFIFGVPNAVLMSLLAIIAGVLPVIGTTVVWIPVTIYLLVQGNTFSAIGVLIFGVLSAIIENLIKPIIVSRRTQMHSSLILFGMVGGLLLFGFLGFILGPLILAYLLITIEIYRNKKSPGLFIPPSK